MRQRAETDAEGVQERRITRKKQEENKARSNNAETQIYRSEEKIQEMNSQRREQTKQGEVKTQRSERAGEWKE